MRNLELWQPTKYEVFGNGTAGATRNRQYLSPGSTLIAALAARWYQHNLERFAHGSLLEIGCGRVPLFAMYRSLVREVICTDWPGSLNGQTHVDFAADLTRGIPIRSSSFDTVIASDVLEHIPEPSLLISEIHRILRVNGVFLLNTPFMYRVHEAPHDYFRYTEHAISRFSSTAGFTVEKIEPIGGASLVMADLLGKMICSIRIPGMGFAASTFQRSLSAIVSECPISREYPLFIGAVLRKSE